MRSNLVPKNVKAAAEFVEKKKSGLTHPLYGPDPKPGKKQKIRVGSVKSSK